MKNNTENPWVSQLWQKINSNALTFEGQSFSFEIEIVTKSILYDYNANSLFPRWKKGPQTSYKERFIQFDQAVNQMPNGFTFTKQYLVLKDGRDRLLSFGRVEEGYKITCNVDSMLSYKIYDSYAKIAIPFKEKLLRNHYELLQKLHYSDFLNKIDPPEVCSPSSGRIITRGFQVLPNGISGMGESIRHFSDFGMANLKNTGECYGMALALIEAKRSTWEKQGELRLSFGAFSDSISASYWLDATNHTRPKLTEW